MTTTSTWRCLSGCSLEGTSGDPATVDKAAAKHTKDTGHGTTVHTTPKEKK